MFSVFIFVPLSSIPNLKAQIYTISRVRLFCSVRGVPLRRLCTRRCCVVDYVSVRRRRFVQVVAVVGFVVAVVVVSSPSCVYRRRRLDVQSRATVFRVCLVCRRRRYVPRGLNASSLR